MDDNRNHKAELIQMMQRCREEIRSLRARLAVVEPKAEAYDNLAAVLRLLPQPPMSYGEDLVWRLEKRIEELTAPPLEPATAD